MKLSNRFIPVLACGGVVLGAGSARAVVSTSFDASLEGWNAVGFNVDDSFAAILSGNVLSIVDNSADAAHDPGGGAFDGNPGGFARFTDVIEDPGSFLRAPAGFTGDLSWFLGGTFSFQHRLFNEGSNVSTIQPYAIIFLNGDPNDLNAYASIQPGPNIGDADTGWVTVSATLDSSELMPVSEIDLGVFDPEFAGDTAESLSSGVLSTDQTLKQVMASVTDIFISFELVDNNSSQVSESAGVDNIILAEAAGLPGDTDGDGDVDNSDLQTAISNFTGPTGSGKTAADGDTDGDGDVDNSDLQAAIAGFTGPDPTPIPEPASLALLGLGGLMIARRRRC